MLTDWDQDGLQHSTLRTILRKPTTCGHLQHLELAWMKGAWVRITSMLFYPWQARHRPESHLHVWMAFKSISDRNLTLINLRSNRWPLGTIRQALTIPPQLRVSPQGIISTCIITRKTHTLTTQPATASTLVCLLCKRYTTPMQSQIPRHLTSFSPSISTLLRAALRCSAVPFAPHSRDLRCGLCSWERSSGASYQFTKTHRSITSP